MASQKTTSSTDTTTAVHTATGRDLRTALRVAGWQDVQVRGGRAYARRGDRVVYVQQGNAEVPTTVTVGTVTDAATGAWRHDRLVVLADDAAVADLDGLVA